MHTKWWRRHHHLRKSIWKESLGRWHQWEVIESVHRHSWLLSHHWHGGTRSHWFGFPWRLMLRSLVHHWREVHILVALRSLHCLIGWALTLHGSRGSWLMLLFVTSNLLARCFGWMNTSLFVGAVRYRRLLFKCGIIWMHFQLNLIINNKISSLLPKWWTVV